LGGRCSSDDTKIDGHRRIPINIETMLHANNIWLFLLATLTLNLTPGPDMLYVIARSLGQGRAAGLVSTCGIAAGCCAHTLAVAFGLASLLAAAPAAYVAIKYAGAAYLIYLGLRILMSRAPLEAGTSVRPDSLPAIFLQGMLTNALNPKVALFFLAFLPQFTDRAAGDMAAQIMILGVLFNLSGTAVNAMVAFAASYMGARLKAYLKETSAFRWLSGGLFIGLGIRLATLH
jgi:threonine/homoserine/homoserine lactone efflux protein